MADDGAVRMDERGTHEVMSKYLAGADTQGSAHVKVVRDIASGAGDESDTPTATSAVTIQIWGWTLRPPPSTPPSTTPANPAATATGGTSGAAASPPPATAGVDGAPQPEAPSEGSAATASPAPNPSSDPAATSADTRTEATTAAPAASAETAPAQGKSERVGKAGVAPTGEGDPPVQSIRLGAGLLPRGLEVAIRTLRKGQRAVLRIASLAGFPSDGAGAAAAVENGGESPPIGSSPQVVAEWERWREAMAQDGAVEVELRLERYKIPQDVLGDGGILKYVKVHGDGKRAAGCVVKATIHAAAGGATLLDKAAGAVEVQLSQGSSATFLLKLEDRAAAVGAEVLEESIRRALGTMRLGEQSRVHVRPEYAFGGDGCAELKVAGDTAVVLDLEVREIMGEAVEEVDESPDARIDRAQQLKAEGTTFYQAGKYEEAAGKYSEAVAQLDQDFLFAEPARSLSRGVKTAACLNIAMCQLKLEKYGDVIGVCDVIIKQEPECVKAHFRKGKAHQGIWEYDQAIAAFTEVLRLEPGQKAATTSLAECREAKKAAHNADREKFKDMFGKQS